jgi:hypothetical protein
MMRATEESSTDQDADVVTSLGIMLAHGYTEQTTGARQIRVEPLAESQNTAIVGIPVCSGAVDGALPQRAAAIPNSRPNVRNRRDPVIFRSDV